MRVLIALSDKIYTRQLSDIFHRAHFLSDRANSCDADIVQDYIKITPTYDLLVHEPHLPGRVAQKIAARLTLDQTLSPPATAHEDDTESVLKKAYTAICLAKGHPASGIITAGDLTLDIWQNQILYQNTALLLKPLEYRILRSICLNKGQFVSTETLIDQLYDPHHSSQNPQSLIRVFMNRIRTTLRDAGVRDDLIEFRRSTGYRIADENQGNNVAPRIKMGEGYLIPSENILTHNDRAVCLTKTQTLILQSLADNRAHRAGYIADYAECSYNSLAVFLTGLRKKMKSINCSFSIEACGEYGYKLGACHPPEKPHLLAPKPAP